MGGKVVLSLLRGTQPKAASVPSSPSSPQKDGQNSEGGGNPTIRPDGPLSPRVKPNSVRLLSFWPKGNRGRGEAADFPLKHPPPTSHSSLSPSLNAKLAFLGVGFSDLPAETNLLGSRSLQPIPPAAPLDLVPSLRVGQAFQFGQGLWTNLSSGELLGEWVNPAVNLRSQWGTEGGGAQQTTNGLPPKGILSIVQPAPPHQSESKGISPQPPVKIEVMEASPSQLTLILHPPQGEGEMRLDVNLSQVDSFLNRVALQSLKDAYGLKGGKGEVTAKTGMDPADQLHLKLSLKKGEIVGEIITPNPKVKRIVEQALPQVKKILSHVGIEMDGLKVSSSLAQGKSSRPAHSKPVASNLHSSPGEEPKNLKISFSSQPIKLQTTPMHHQSPTSHQVKDLNNLIEQLIGKLKVNLQHGRSEAMVSLKPDYLGHLQIKLTLDGKSIVGKILVDNPLAKSLIQNSLPHLRSSLVNLGIQVEHLDVFVGERFPSPQQRSSPKGKRYQPRFSPQPLLGAEALSPPLGVNMAAGGGVDYLA